MRALPLLTERAEDDKVRVGAPKNALEERVELEEAGEAASCEVQKKCQKRSQIRKKVCGMSPTSVAYVKYLYLDEQTKIVTYEQLGLVS